MADDDANEPAYIGRAPCGCVRLAIVDTPAGRRDTAKELAAAVRDGYTIERTTVAAVRALPIEQWTCTHRQRPQAAVRRPRPVQAILF